VRRILLVSAVSATILAAVAVLAFGQNIPVANSLARATGQLELHAAAFTSPDARHESDATVIASGISPRSLAIDPRANVYVTNAAAPNRVFTLTGLRGLAAHNVSATQVTARLALVAGDGTAGSLGDGGNALAAQFNLKLDSLAARSGIALASDGTIFLADTLNSTIRRIAGSDSAEPGVTRSIAGRWAATQTSAIREPLGLALDRNGNLYVADQASGAVDLLPDAVGTAPGEQQVQVLAHVASPATIALTADGRKVFAASPDTGAVVEIDTQTRAIQPVPGFAAGTGDSQGVPVPCSASWLQATGSKPVCPAGLAVDGAGNLFVADANSGDILRVGAKTSAAATVITGLRSPGDMSFDSGGNLYVAEQGANRIVKFASMAAATGNLTLTPPPALPPPPAPRVCPQTAPFNFCDQAVGGSTPTQAFTLTNNTSAAVTGLAISFGGTNTGDFQASSNTCGGSLAAGASCSINVDFAPAASGSRAATLTVADSAGDSATSDVTGTGDDFQLVLDGSPQEQSVVQGGTIAYNFKIVPDAVFGGDVNVVCPSNLPSLTTCTPSQSTITVTPGTAVSFAITFQTTYNGVTGGLPTNGSVPVLPANAGRKGPLTPFALFCGAVPLLLALAIFVFIRRRSRRATATNRFSANAIAFGSLFLAAGALVFIAGCKHHSVPSNLNTPAGVTSLTVQGTAQDAGRGITISLDVVGRG
jgi:sugar lactone lactonase YvrE